MEEVEIIKVTMQGTDMFLRLAGAGMKEGLKFIKGFAMFLPNAYRWWQKTAEMHMKKEITKEEFAIIKARQGIAAGSMNSAEFMKVFSAEERVILNIPDTSAERFRKLAKKNGLTYTLLADLNPSDGFFQIMVPKSQSDIYELVIEKMTAEELNEIEALKGYLENEINELKKQQVEIKNDLTKMKEEGKEETDEYKAKEAELNACSEKIKELEHELLMADKMHSGEMTTEEYMKTNEFAFNHADLFADLMDAGIAADSKGILEILEYKSDRTVQVTKDLETALTDVTERKDMLDTDKRTVICNLSNPDTYIEAYVYTSEREDKTYVCTQYDLYVEGKKQTCEEFAHGEFTHFSDAKAANSSEAGDRHWENMKAEIKEKGVFEGQVAVFNSVSEYREYLDKSKKGPEKEYIVNPNYEGMAIRRESVADTSAYKYTIVKNGEDTSISFEISSNTDKNLVGTYMKQIERQAKQINPNTDYLNNEWLELPETDYEKWLEIAENRKTPSEGDINKEGENINAELNKELEDIMPEEVKEQLKEEGKAEAERSKVIIEIPEGSYGNVLQKDTEKAYIIVDSNNSNYSIEIPYSKLKLDNDRRFFILEENESIEIIDNHTGRSTGLYVTDLQSFNEFISEEGSKGIKNKPLKLQKPEGIGERNAAKIS